MGTRIGLCLKCTFKKIPQQKMAKNLMTPSLKIMNDELSWCINSKYCWKCFKSNHFFAESEYSTITIVFKSHSTRPHRFPAFLPRRNWFLCLDIPVIKVVAGLSVPKISGTFCPFCQNIRGRTVRPGGIFCPRDILSQGPFCSRDVPTRDVMS
jgi:hypothetical protein